MLRARVCFIICHVSSGRDAVTQSLPPNITHRLSRHTRYTINGASPYNSTQVDSMCSYLDCRSSSTELDQMCKLAENNVYWKGLSIEEQAKGFQSFREEVLRKAQSAFLYRHVPPSIVLIAPAIVVRRLTPSAAQHRHRANRLCAGAENTLAEPVCGGGEERQPSVSTFAFLSALPFFSCFLQRILLPDHHHHVAAGVRPLHAERVLDLPHQRAIHWHGYSRHTRHGTTGFFNMFFLDTDACFFCRYL